MHRQAKTKEIEFCALQWADESAAKGADLKKCEATALQLIPLFEKEGFKGLTAEDVGFPSLWIAFNKKVKDTNDLKENTKKFNDIFKW